MTLAASDDNGKRNQQLQTEPRSKNADFFALTKSTGLRHQLAWHLNKPTQTDWCFSQAAELIRRVEVHGLDPVVLDLDSAGLETLEALTCLEALGLRPPIICLSRRSHLGVTRGVLEIVPPDRLPSSLQRLTDPANSRKPLTTGDYLDLCQAGRLSVTLQLMFSELADSEIQIYEGRLVNAFSGDTSGIHALRAMLLRRPKTTDLRPLTSPPAAQNIDRDLTEISNQQRTEKMAKVDLKPLTEIDGFLGTCLVDSESGMTLAAIGSEGINIEIAASGNSKVVKAKNQTMAALELNDSIEDLLITLQKQYHLIRPLAAKNTLFLYLALDRKKANLGLARHYLRSFEVTFSL